MPVEILHFNDAKAVLETKKILQDVTETMNYIEVALSWAHFKGELLRQALDDCGWRENIPQLSIIGGRRYLWKGFKRGIAVDGNFSAYEYILDGLFRLQIGYDKGRIESGVLMLTSIRSAKSPYGETKEMVIKELAEVYPTISMPITVALFNLGRSELPEE